MKKNNGIGTRTTTLCFFLFLILISPLAGAQSSNNNNATNENNDPYYNRVSPSLAIIIVILIAALFLMGFFSIYIRHCSESPSASVRNLTGATGRSRRGLDPAVIEKFPTLEYSAVKEHKIGKDALECAVCLNEFEDTETLRLIPKCDHVFHPECIDEWLSLHTTCPVCRANLVPQPGDSVRGVPVFGAAGLQEDIEAQNDAVSDQQQSTEAEPDVKLNRSRTRGSRTGRPRKFSRSHSTGHSMVQPGENTERFTLRLPLVVREQLLNQQLHRARSLILLPRETSSRRGYRTGGEGSSRGKSLRRLDRSMKSDRWVFTMAPPFLVRASSIRSPRVGNSAGEGTSSTTFAPSPLSRPPV